MARGLILLFVLAATVAVEARQLPLTVKDVSLLLRSGYSNASVMQELSRRHFVDNVDFAKEDSLVKAGASKELIAALNSGTYALPPEQSAAAQQQIVDLTIRRAAEAERAQKSDTQYQAQVASERSAKSAPVMMKNVIHDATTGDLVRVQDGNVAHIEGDALENKKLIALYFSAQWCGPCKKFTPQLVDYYNRVAPQHPEFEIVFCSADRSADAMQKYMRAEKMPWPAIEFQKLEANEVIRRYAGKGIPCLVLVDPSGRVVSDSYAGDKYLGPEKVLTDIDTIFAAVAAKRVANIP